MEISDTWAPLLVSAVRDAVLYQEHLLSSDTLGYKADYEEHLVHLTQFFEYIKSEYKRVELQAGIPLEQLI